MTAIPDNCWQVAAGDGDRNYADVCLRNGVILMGPSSAGPWRNSYLSNYPPTAEILKKQGLHSRKITNLDQFVNRIAPGDLVVLRVGMTEVHGVGIVASGYEYNENFSDVDGWDIAHTHRVKWVWKRSKDNRHEGDFRKLLNWGDTTQRLDSKSSKTKPLFDWIRTLPEPSEDDPERLKEFKRLEISEISRHLFDYGMSSGSLSDLESRVRDLCSLAKWYKNYCKPSESETVAHLVIPLLLALGWSPQRIQLEFHQRNIGRADVALYANGNRDNYEPIGIIEAKKYGYSCMTAEEQVRTYARQMKYLRRLIVTDGIRYGIFVRHNNEESFPERPTAYLNLSDLRDCYPIYGNCKGADEAMLYLSSAWSHRFEHPSCKGSA